ncbi:hypothetical protein PEL8287_02966 [Roseovarius litorisediminis]|uniref:DUF2125 domain-containing protein n=1 Tax=Roseovarius litorisediminis TaxID=1312363 RepID=A0A1Y5T9L3_9RHOB|nr:DUF2125 domain-containing protein [Roseovarius litorisediminis]SLN55381.1 hypothetical protein PEL8287_02966 [Roseovarius litorisediminis]
MRFLLTIILAASGLWAGYWFVGSIGLKTGFESWFEARRAEGWATDYSDLSIQGFPNRFDTNLIDLSLADPETGIAWEAPFFQILALSYRPSHVIAVWPHKQLIATPLEKYDIQSDDMRASLVLAATTSLELERSTLTAKNFQVSPANSDNLTRISALTLAAEHMADKGDAIYRLGISTDGLMPSESWRMHVDPTGTLPQALDALRADLTVQFDKPWDRSAIEVSRPQIRLIRIKIAEARWGQLELQAAGEVSVDKSGLPTGEITIKAKNWRDILKLAGSSGAMPDVLVETLESGLSMMSQLAGNPKTLDIPLGFRNGRIMLGPLPIGPAPVLKLR